MFVADDVVPANPSSKGFGMISVVNLNMRGPVAVIVMDRPPVNGLGIALRCALVEAMDRACADPAIQAIVLTGTARVFSGGADIAEFDTPLAWRAPNLPTVIDVIENSPKPVIAAIAGNCLGGGFELALGCHYRVALADASLGLPEIKLGLMPGAGGTQRLPRLVGVQAALNLILSGQALPAQRFENTPLIDRVIQGDLIDGAVVFAQEVVARQAAPVRVRDRLIREPAAEAFLQYARTVISAVAQGMPAPLHCVDAVVKAIAEPFNHGIKAEREAFVTLMNTSESRALRHVFSAERMARRIVDVPEDAPLRPIRSVGVVGAGTMGGGIAMNFANAGIPVYLLEVKKEALDRGLATIRRNYESSMRKGKLTPAQVEERMALIQPTLEYAPLGNVDLVVEAVFEEMAVKEQVFRQLDQVAREGAILATNTSFLDVNRIASFTRRPQDVIGLHFFSPANVMRLLEVVRGAQTAHDVLATCMQLAKRIKKVAVISGVCDGFIGNRMVACYGGAASLLINQGALPQQVDKALQVFGMAMGPFRMADLAGLDIGWATRKRIATQSGVPMLPVVSDLLCEAGRFGQKTGDGWYRYETGKRDPIPDPLVEQLITSYRAGQGITARKVPDVEVVERCIYALINEGARIIEEGIAQRASDVDVVYVNGYGFPSHRGGPMKYADEVGLPNVVRTLRRFASEAGADPFWQPAPLLVKLAAEGRTFN